MPTIHVQLAITLDDNAIKSLAEIVVPARLRASHQAIFAGQTPPEDQVLLIDSKQAAKILKVSDRTLWKMHTSGEMPPPIRIGRAVRWSLNGLTKWVEAGCPVERRRSLFMFARQQRGNRPVPYR